MATIHQRVEHGLQHLEEHQWLQLEHGLQQLRRLEHKSQQHGRMENGFYGHLCLAQNHSLLIDSSVRFGDVFGSQWMGEEMARGRSERARSERAQAREMARGRSERARAGDGGLGRARGRSERARKRGGIAAAGVDGVRDP